MELPLHLWQLHMTLSWRALLDGRVDDAEAEANTAFEIGNSAGYAEAVLAYGAQLLDIRRQQGRLDEMIEFLEQVDGEAALDFRQLLAVLYCDLGRLDDARPLLALDVDSKFETIPRDEAWLAVMMSCADTATALGDEEASRLLYERLLPFDGRVGAVYAWITGATARHLGRLATVLGEYSAADAHLRDALELHERIRAPYWIASTQLDWADLLDRRAGPGDDVRAADLRAAALATASTHGYAGLLRR